MSAQGTGECCASLGACPAERVFDVMGTDAHVIVWQEPDPVPAPEDLLDLAEAELNRLEQLWSRFVPDSDVCRMNASPGELVEVATETIEILELACVARSLSGGLFDHTLLSQLEAAGYDVTFDEVKLRTRDQGLALDLEEERSWSLGGEKDTGEVVIDRDESRAACPAGRAIDLGGIGKGRAADLVAARLLVDGALGACVNLGGDLRVVGETPGAEGIVVAVEHPLDVTSDVTLVRLRNAAVATSSRARRSWEAEDGIRHHLIDPFTGRPARTDLVSVTAIAGTAAWAEVVAKVSVLSSGAGPDHDHDDVPGRAPRLILGEDGSVVRAGGFERFEA